MVKDIQIYYLENFRRIEADWDQKASVKLYKQIRKTPKTPLKGHFNNYTELNVVDDSNLFNCSGSQSKNPENREISLAHK
jgi:hypothetical protein